MTFGYVALIVSQGDAEWAPVMLFVIMMAVASSAALAAEMVSDVVIGRRLLVLSALVFAVVGALGIFTIGLPFLVAAGLALVGAIRMG
jgi:hypothetical protein